MTLWLTQMSGPAARRLGTSVKQLAGGSDRVMPKSYQREGQPRKTEN